MDAASLLPQANGLTLSHAWHGYGSALFLELGELTQSTKFRRDGTRRNPTGQVSVCLYEGWLISVDQNPVYTTDVEGPLWEELLAFCVGRSVVKMEVAANQPELRIVLADGIEITVFSQADREADWAIAFQSMTPPLWLYLHEGAVRIDDGAPDQ